MQLLTGLAPSSMSQMRRCQSSPGRHARTKGFALPCPGGELRSDSVGASSFSAFLIQGMAVATPETVLVNLAVKCLHVGTNPSHQRGESRRCRMLPAQQRAVVLLLPGLAVVALGLWAVEVAVHGRTILNHRESGSQRKKTVDGRIMFAVYFKAWQSQLSRDLSLMWRFPLSCAIDLRRGPPSAA